MINFKLVVFKLFLIFLVCKSGPVTPKYALKSAAISTENIKDNSTSTYIQTNSKFSDIPPDISSNESNQPISLSSISSSPDSSSDDSSTSNESQFYFPGLNSSSSTLSLSSLTSPPLSHTSSSSQTINFSKPSPKSNSPTPLSSLSSVTPSSLHSSDVFIQTSYTSSSSQTQNSSKTSSESNSPTPPSSLSSVTPSFLHSSIVSTSSSSQTQNSSKTNSPTSSSSLTPSSSHSSSSSTQTSRSVYTCLDLDDGDDLSQVTFLDRLTAPCRYDKLTRPGGDVRGARVGPRSGDTLPVNVHVQLDIRHVEASENLQFKMHMLLQYRYRDDRLNYARESPGRARIVGEERLRERIWIPHVLLDNERESSIMGHDVKDIYMSIEPNGEVTYSRRIKATLYCWMNLQKFPFDEQECFIRFLSWTYNTSELLLKWEEPEPVVMSNQLHLTEYSLLRHWTENSVQEGSKLNRGAFIGNYSCLTFRFHMAREMGFYMLDYFVPSIMLVCISWVSFWLQADASAPRITIGTSTMLSFITLATAQTRTLPKVSYIKASEIWFLGCTCFIFGSMVEFAFVNIIWRRKADVELMKVNSKSILKCTLTPRLHRKEILKATGALQKSHSCSSLDNAGNDSSKMPQYNNYLTVHSFSPPRITTESVDDLIEKSPSMDNISLTVPVGLDRSLPNVNGSGSGSQINHQTFTKMTPQEIAQWIDKRSRLVFPCAFIVFNAFYWGFVYWL